MASQRTHGTACKTCRRRGRKCDKTLPQCNSCLSKGIECEGYVFRWSGVASRGKMAGKKYPLVQEEEINAQTGSVKPSMRHTDAVQVSVSLTTPVEREIELSEPDLSMEDLDMTLWAPSQFVVGGIIVGEWNDVVEINDPASESENALIAQKGPEIPSLPKFFNNLDPFNIPLELRFILDYHLREVSPRLCVDNNSPQNPYSQYIMPMAIQKPSLLYACAALAACHFYVRLADQESYLQCLKFRGKAMKRLQEHLFSVENAKDDGTLATILMLTLCDICLGGFSNFDAHFRAAKRLIALRRPNHTQANFVEQYLAWLDTMAATSQLRSTIFSSTDVASFTSSSSEWSYDVFPSPISQFSVLSEIVNLYNSHPDQAHPDAYILSVVETHKTTLLTLPLHTSRGIFWQHLTEAYRHAIILYLIRLFHCATDEDEILWLTSSVFWHAKAIPTSTGWADQLLWPLFYAALEITDERRKQWLRERALDMQLSGGFKNVNSAMEILEEVWAGRRSGSYVGLFTGCETGNMLFV